MQEPCGGGRRAKFRAQRRLVPFFDHRPSLAASHGLCLANAALRRPGTILSSSVRTPTGLCVNRWGMKLADARELGRVQRLDVRNPHRGCDVVGRGRSRHAASRDN